MNSLLLYVGPGLGMATIVIVLIVLLIVALSLFFIAWGSIKKFFVKIKQTISKQ